MWSESNEAWAGGATPHLRMGLPLKQSFVTFDRGGQTGPPRSNAADDRLWGGFAPQPKSGGSG